MHVDNHHNLQSYSLLCVDLIYCYMHNVAT